MSTVLLHELHQEVRRLYIAGSDLAAGDFRLKRLLPQFQQLGERAPIFKRLAEGIAAVIDADSQASDSSAEQLQELGVLLHAVLYTLGSTSPEGELQPITSMPISLSTKLTYRRLAELETALKTTGGGRYELVTQSFQDGLFADLRLFPLALDALNDPYIEIAEFVMNQILPSYGASVVPHLVRTFNKAGGKGEARKLTVIGRMSSDEALDLIEQSADSGSDEVRVTAIGLLAGREAYEETLLGWTKDKKKVVREAAYHAIAAGGTPRAVDWLYQAFESKDIALAAEASHRCSAASLTEQLAGDLQELLRQLEADHSDKKQAEELIGRVGHYLTALRGKQAARLEEIYTEALRKHELYVKIGCDHLMDQAIRYAEAARSLAMLPLIYDLAVGHASYLPFAFRVSYFLMTPAQLFEHYAAIVNASDLDKKTKAGREAVNRRAHIIGMMMKLAYWLDEEDNDSPHGVQGHIHSPAVPTIGQLASSAWDPRWLDWLIQVDASEAVPLFIRPGHQGAIQYLLNKVPTPLELRYHLENLLIGLDRAEADEGLLLDILMRALEEKRSYSTYVFSQSIVEMIGRLPATEYRERLAAVAPMYRYEAGQQLKHVLEAMNSEGAM